MEKKFYSRPTCKVVVLDTNDLICTSPVGSTDGENNPFSTTGGRNSGSSRANNRNDIWGDE